MIGDPNLHTRGVDTTTQSVGTEVQYLDCRKQGSLVLYLCAGWVVGVCGCGCGCGCGCVSKGTSGTLKSTTLVSKVKYPEGTYGWVPAVCELAAGPAWNRCLTHTKARLGKEGHKVFVFA